MQEANCSGTFDNYTAEQWANYAKELEHELGAYKYMARVCGIILLNLLFLAVIFSIPVKKRSILGIPTSEDPNNNPKANNNSKQANKEMSSV